MPGLLQKIPSFETARTVPLCSCNDAQRLVGAESSSSASKPNAWHDIIIGSFETDDGVLTVVNPDLWPSLPPRD